MRNHTRNGQLAFLRTIVPRVTLACMCLLIAACGSEQAAVYKLRVSGIPDSKGTEIDTLGDAVEAYLSAELGV